MRSLSLPGMSAGPPERLAFCGGLLGLPGFRSGGPFCGWGLPFALQCHPLLSSHPRPTAPSSPMAKEKIPIRLPRMAASAPSGWAKCLHCNAWELARGRPSPRAPARTASRAKSVSRWPRWSTWRPPTSIARPPAMKSSRPRAGRRPGRRRRGADRRRPGIGKSTFAAGHRLAVRCRCRCSTSPAKSRAQEARRAAAGLSGAKVRILAEINLEKILATIEAEQPAFCVIDSIQTIYSEQLTSAPARWPRCANAGPAHAHRQGQGLRHGAGGPRHQRGVAGRPACSSTSSTRCCTSRATPPSFRLVRAPSRTALAP